MKESRPPIVTVLGHVDHGKTSLLDAIRETHVTSREAGGITQSIGASSVITKQGRKITFIDTPGHAAFSQMRSRGSKVADIAILVVAADDGPKPQTWEALEHIRASGASMIIAFTKVDLATASVETAQTQLEKQGVYFESRGGDIPWVEISSKTGSGIEQLLDLIILIADIADYKSDPTASLEAVVIETTRDRRGQLVSVIVRSGQIKISDDLVAGSEIGRVKSIFDENGKIIKVINPGEAGQILGFSSVPSVGAKVEHFDPNKVYKERQQSSPQLVEEGKLAIFLKTKTSGSLEALKGILPAGVVVVGSGVGDVNESDILFAKSANASVYCFEAKTPSSVVKLADTEGVSIQSFNIIYELVQRLELELKKGEVVIKAKAEVLASFPYEGKKVAGVKVTAGIINKGDKLILQRVEKDMGQVKIVSMRKIKNSVDQAKAGEELGILFEPQLDFSPGDVLLSIG